MYRAATGAAVAPFLSIIHNSSPQHSLLIPLFGVWACSQVA